MPEKLTQGELAYGSKAILETLLFDHSSSPLPIIVSQLALIELRGFTIVFVGRNDYTLV